MELWLHFGESSYFTMYRKKEKVVQNLPCRFVKGFIEYFKSLSKAINKIYIRIFCVNDFKIFTMKSFR